MGEKPDDRYGRPPRGCYDDLGETLTTACLIYPKSIAVSVMREHRTTEQLTHLVKLGQRMYTYGVIQRNAALLPTPCKE